MACTNCGQRGTVEEYTIRFTGGPNEPRRMDLELCDGCIEEFRAESDIELV